MFLALQGVIFQKLDDPFEVWRPIHYAYAAGYVGWSATLIFILATGGFLARGRTPEARAALNDELTAANRRSGYQVGFWFVMGAIPVLYALSRLDLTTLPEALRVLFAIGVAMPAVAFAGLERRQDA